MIFPSKTKDANSLVICHTCCNLTHVLIEGTEKEIILSYRRFALWRIVNSKRDREISHATFYSVFSFLIMMTNKSPKLILTLIHYF